MLGLTVPDLLSPERARQVEMQWRAALTPRNAGQLFAGLLAAVPLFEGDPAFGADGRPVGEPRLILQLPPLSAPAFALRLADEAMQSRSPAALSFRPGEIVVFTERPPVRSGELAFVVTLKARLFRKVIEERNQRLRLAPLNDAFPALVVAKEEVVRLWRLARRIQEF